MNISVTMRIYNAEKYLAEAISSVLAQTYEKFEFVIVDDGSTDRSAEIVMSFDDPRIRYVYQENRGITGAAQRALAECKGDFVAMIDSDDAWEPEKLERQVEVINSDKSVVLVTTNVILIGSDNRIAGTRTFPVDDQRLQKSLRLYNCITHSAALFDREKSLAVGGYVDQTICEDYDLWLRLAKRGKIANVSEKLVRYRLKSGPFDAKHLQYLLRGTIQARERGLSSNDVDGSLWTNVVTLAYKMMTVMPPSLVNAIFKFRFYTSSEDNGKSRS